MGALSTFSIVATDPKAEDLGMAVLGHLAADTQNLATKHHWNKSRFTWGNGLRRRLRPRNSYRGLIRMHGPNKPKSRLRQLLSQPAAY